MMFKSKLFNHRKNISSIGIPFTLLDFENYKKHHWGLLIGCSIAVLILVVVLIVVVVPLVVKTKLESKKSDCDYEKVN